MYTASPPRLPRPAEPARAGAVLVRQLRFISHKLVNVLGELVQTTAGKWITHPPSRCPNGHTLGPDQLLVGQQACLGHGGGTRHGRAAHAIRRCSDRRSTSTARRSMGQRRCGSRPHGTDGETPRREAGPGATHVADWYDMQFGIDDVSHYFSGSSRVVERDHQDRDVVVQIDGTQGPDGGVTRHSMVVEANMEAVELSGDHARQPGCALIGAADVVEQMANYDTK